MSKRRLALLIVLVWALLAPASVAQSADEVPVVSLPPLPDEPAYAPGQLLVKFREGAALAAAEDVRGQFAATLMRRSAATGSELWQVPAGRELEIADALCARPDVAYAHPDWIVYALDVTPNDPSYALFQWNLPIINLPAAWEITTGAPVVIAVLDTGVSLTHPDLVAKLVPGWDFVNGDSDPSDDHGHGTHVAGIAGATTNNGIGIAGVSWGARIMPVKVMRQDGYGYLSDVATGIEWATNNGARVVNMSLGGAIPAPDALVAAIGYAHARGVVCVAAMGNSGDGTVHYPAALSHVIAVAATGPTDERASYSNYGPHCDLAAPGGDMSLPDNNPTDQVYSTWPWPYLGDLYRHLEGTSMATPHVAGAAALLTSIEPMLAPGLRMSPALVEVALRAGARDLGAPGHDVYYGAGRLDVERSLQLAMELEPQMYLPLIARNW